MEELMISNIGTSVCVTIILLVILFSINRGSNKKVATNLLISVIGGLILSWFQTTESPQSPQQSPMPSSVLIQTENTVATPYTEPAFNNRSSEQFNYTIDYPSDFVIEGGKGQDTEDDFNLSSPDRKATLNFTARIIDGTLPDKFTIANFRKTYAGTEMYCDDQLESDGWYVVSTKAADGAFHYRKCIFTDGIVRMYTFSFPTEQEDVYLLNYDYVSHIEESFRKLY